MVENGIHPVEKILHVDLNEASYNQVQKVDACRVLLALGITGRLEMWRQGKAWPDMVFDIERAAKWTVLENEDEGPRFILWKPHPRAVSRGARSLPERAEQIPALDLA